MSYGSHALDQQSSCPDGIAITCICGKLNVTGDEIQCVLCQSWQHAGCYYASRNLQLGPHGCLMCTSKAAELMPTRAESPPLLLRSITAPIMGHYTRSDQDIPRFLQDTARSISDHWTVSNASERSQYQYAVETDTDSESPFRWPDRHMQSPSTSRLIPEDRLESNWTEMGNDVPQTSSNSSMRSEILSRTQARAPRVSHLSSPSASHTYGRTTVQPSARIPTNHVPRVATPQVSVRGLRGLLPRHDANSAILLSSTTPYPRRPHNMTSPSAGDRDISERVRQLIKERRKQLIEPNPYKVRHRLSQEHASRIPLAHQNSTRI
jgi:hypothetical protein